MRTGFVSALCGASAMIRGVGLLLLLVTAALCGNSAAVSLEQRVRRLRKLELFCDAAASELKFLLPTVGELLTHLAARAEYAELGFLQAMAGMETGFPECWAAAVTTDKTLSAEEREILRTIGETLGSTELAGQLSALALCRERFASCRESAEADLLRRGRLCRSMGLLTGIFLVILLL